MPEIHRTIRVLHLITRFHSGGAETTTLRTLSALTESEIEYQLFLATGAEYDRDELKKAESLGTRTMIFESIRHYNPLTVPVAVIAVAWFLHKNNIDILHTHSTEAGIIGRIAAWIAGTQLVIHEIHGDPIAQDRNSLLNKSVLFLERLCARVTDVFVAKSETIRDTFLSRGIGNENKYCIIPHSIETAKFDVDETIDFCDDSITLLYVGRLADGKGIEDALEAINRAIGSDELKIKFLLAGKGPIKNKLQEKVKEKDISDSVEFLGYRDDIPELMNSADALILPSYREGTPRVITEALASGTPVLSTTVAGIPDQVQCGETGILIEPGDVASLEDHIRDICLHTERWEKMGIKGKSTIGRHEIGSVQSRWRELYENAIKGS